MSKAYRGVVVAVLASVVVLSSSSSALAKLYSSSSEKQTVPGITERTIWSSNQVVVYRLPKNVTHVGNIHVELTYKPADRDCYVVLLDEDGQVLPGTYEQGRLGQWSGKEVIDYAVTSVAHTDWNEPDGSDIQGDAYYILVQSANAESWYRIRGYVPRTVAGSDDTTSDDTLTRAKLQWPSSAKKWATIWGAPYGGAWNFTPTSQGTAYARLEYTAVAAQHELVAPSPAMPASFEQYVYPKLWQPIVGSLPVEQPNDPGDLSHWDLWNLNHHLSHAPVAGDDWYGLEGTFTVQAAGPFKPWTVYHYVPILWSVSSDPSAGPAAPPAVGKKTVGYKATLLIPQNLRFAKATKKVRRNRKATLRGTLALPDSSAPDATVAWASAGTKVKIQRKKNGHWATLRTVSTGANGVWTTRIRMRATTLFRAYWPSDGTRRAEVSFAKKVVVRR